MMIQIDLDQVSEIVYRDLVSTRESFRDDLLDTNTCIFSTTDLYDKILLQKHIEALDLLIEWYKP